MLRNVSDVTNISVNFTPMTRLHPYQSIEGPTVTLSVADIPTYLWRLVSSPEVYVHGLVIADLVVAMPPGPTKNVLGNITMPKNISSPILFDTSLTQYFIGKSLSLLAPVEYPEADDRYKRLVYLSVDYVTGPSYVQVVVSHRQFVERFGWIAKRERYPCVSLQSVCF